MPVKPRNNLLTYSSEETFAAGVEFASTLKGSEIVAFFGEVGSGKTTFLKGMISALAKCSPDEITSPTFTYLHLYEGPTPIYHFDLYRLPNQDAFIKAGFFEYFQMPGICCIEWAEKIENQLPNQTIRVTLSHEGLNQRQIIIS